ncbi:hypothetical protein M0812_23231 [Anaeramoeba flamelloides]|uniref:Uncharacterized protein n=1 Tax=Anaeramoeba flamelloides TaxID=1746091 RepID=A0AAV7YL64_9EUKA|nr:hypothetical protein M0812_23231 [Anaeramoeba flamelloides]
MSQRDQNQSLTNSDLLRMEQFSSMLLGYSDQSTIKDFFSERNYNENSISQIDQNRSFSPTNIRQSLTSSQFEGELFSFKEENEISYQDYQFENMELKRDIETLQYQVDQLVIEINKETQLRKQINEELVRIKKCVNLSQQQLHRQQQQQQFLSSKYQNNYYLKKKKNQTQNHFRSRNTNNSSKSLFLEKNQNYRLQSNQNISNNNSPKKKKKRRYSDQSFLYKKSHENESIKQTTTYEKTNNSKKSTLLSIPSTQKDPITLEYSTKQTVMSHIFKQPINPMKKKNYPSGEETK